MKFLRTLFHKRQRAIDLRILWPALKEGTPDIDTARAAFLLHAAEQPCWVDLFNGDMNKLTEHIFTLT